MISIYGLINTTGHLFYIGQTRSVKQRTNTHRYHFGDCNLIVLEDVQKSQADEAEKFWIRYARFLGCSLRNRNADHNAMKGRAFFNSQYCDVKTADLSCLKCGYTWTPRRSNPVCCPSCKSMEWNGKIRLPL